MKFATTVVAGLLVALAFAFVPSAAANQNVCTPGNNACVYTYSYGVGSQDCSASGSTQYNSAGVVTSGTPAGYANANAYTSCYHYDFFGWDYGGSSLGANYYTFGGPLGTAYGGMGWYNSFFGSSSYCDTYEYHNNAHTGYAWTSYGCPAGAPPAVPAVLP